MQLRAEQRGAPQRAVEACLAASSALQATIGYCLLRDWFAEQLEREDGLSVEVLDLRTLLPMDDEAIVATVRKTNRVLVVHEDTRTGGIAGEITARINERAFEWLCATAPSSGSTASAASRPSPASRSPTS